MIFLQFIINIHNLATHFLTLALMLHSFIVKENVEGRNTNKNNNDEQNQVQKRNKITRQKAKNEQTNWK